MSLAGPAARWRLKLGGAKARASVALAVAVAAVALGGWQLHQARRYYEAVAATVEAQQAGQAAVLQDLQAVLARQNARLDQLFLVEQGRPAAATVATARLACLTDELVARVKASPQSVSDAYATCGGELRAAVGDALGVLAQPDYFAIFVTLLSYRWAPYGAGVGITMEALRDQAVMQCSQYAALAGQLFRYAPDQGDALFRVVGVDGGAVMNHAQLFYSRGPVHLLLDPTIGLVAVADFDEVLRGIPINPRRIVDFYDRSDIPAFRNKVVKALTEGLYRPSDLLYYFEGIDAYLAANVTSEDFLTPGGVRLRARAPATAAAAAAAQ